MRTSQTRSNHRGIRILSILALAACLWPAVSTAQTYTISPPPFLLAQDNAGAIINNACIWTYEAGTSTEVATYTTSSGTANANPIRSDSAGRFTAYLQPGQSYKFVYESACTPPAHGTTLRTADNIAAIPTSGLNVDVTGTAGEALSAGDVVYLSDGSGALNAGQWYKADSDLIYGSIGAGQIGIAVTAITSGQPGSIRIQGRATGLTGLSAGLAYYVDATAAALTSTAPSNARLVGVSDSATSLIVTPNPAASLAAATPGICQCRITLTTVTPVTTSDVTAATSVFLTPYKGNRITLFNGSRWREYAFTELSLGIGGDAADTNYDLFVYDNAGTLTLERLAWTNATTRATAIVLQNGVYVKSGVTTRLYVGTYRTTGVIGQTEDSLTKRYVWNYYNRVPRVLRRLETTATWTYTTATVRQANGAAANQVDMVIGVAEARLQLRLQAASRNTNADILRSVGIGEDSTTTYMAQAVNTSAGDGGGTIAIGAIQNHVVSLTHYPAIGRHFYAWNEDSAATGTTTWIGTVVPTGGTNSSQAGLTGEIEG